MQLKKEPGKFSARRRALLGFLALAAAVGALGALLETPYDGPWTGTNSESRAVSFTVSGGGTQWSSFSYAIAFVCSYTGGTVTTTITQSGPGAITNGEFSYSSATLSFTGAFDTAASASGTYTLTDYPVTHGTGIPTYPVHTDYINLSGTWTTTFGGTVPTITVTSPNGGESWEAGSAHDITWTSTGTVPNVKLDYSTDGGTGWTPIAASVSNTGAFSWTIPSVVSATCLVRISDAAYPEVQDTSDAAFSISEALSITVTSPNGGETWETGISNEITWTSTGSVGNVRIEISFNGGGNYYDIDASTENDGAYSIASVWENPSTSCLVRVSETDGSPSDVSDAVFSIVVGPSVTVTSPNGGESWAIATTHDITWTSTGSVENVKLEYWTYPEMIWKTIVASTANTGTYSWDVPGPASVYCQIRVSDVAHEGKTDTNDGSFSILTNTVLQRQALIALYNSTGGDHWSNNSGWKTPPLDEDGFAMPGTEGSWAGLIVESQTVVRINLGYNSLTGSLPAELGDLSSLYQIEFWSNQLSGPIPATLGNLVRLYSIRLDHNQLSGPIPPELGNLNSLYYLFLDNNQLSGPIPPELGGLSSLGNAYFDSNLLSGTIPGELSNLTSLDALSFKNNQLSGAIPPELGNMMGLNYLYLSGNQLSGAIPPELGNLIGLETLDLQSNQLSGAIPVELASLSNLRRLHLESNELSGAIPGELGSLTNLRDLSLSSNHLSGPIPAELGSLVNLWYLGLSSNQLSGSIPAELGNVTGVWTLYLNSNQLSGEVPPSLASLTGLASGYTDFGHNALYATDPALNSFLSSKDPDWASTQTVTPTDIAASPLGGTTIIVSWTPILYQADLGGYIVSAGTTLGGPYTVTGQTADKTVAAMNVAGLTPGTPYYFVVKTHTDAHGANQNALESGDSGEVSSATLAQLAVQGTILTGGSPLPGVAMMGLPGNPMTNGSGIYQAAVDVGWGGTVTPMLAGYGFVPPNRSYAGLAADQLNQDYEAALAPTTITLTAPNGGEAWGIGSIHDITWTWTGDMPNVKIEYSTNGGTDWTTIVGSTSNSGSYSWPISGPASVTCLIRVSDVLYPSVFNTSDAVFSIVPAIPSSQRQALIAFYNATNGESWLNNSGWKTPPLYTDGFAMPGTEWAWFGVTGENTVSVLDLDNNNLTGVLPTALGNLTNLTYLDLHSNRLSGPIPPVLGTLIGLYNIYLSDNQLSGSIPPELGNLTNMYYLLLNNNQLSGSIPPELGNLANLAELNLFFNQLSGPIPAELGNLTSLYSLYLFSNQLSGSIPAELGNMSSLRYLNLHDNQLSGPIPPELGNLTILESLYLWSNRLSGQIPPEIGNLTALKSLYLRGNRLSGVIPASLMNLTALVASGSEFGYNALYATDPDLIAFLNSKDPDWASTQTIVPTDVTASPAGGTTAIVSWTPIIYQGDTGGYVVSMGTTSGGPYTVVGQTANKSVSSMTVSGLTPGTPYYYVVRTHTDVHAQNVNALDSADSAETAAATFAQVLITGKVLTGGLPLPNVVMAGLPGNPMTDPSGVYQGLVNVGWGGTVTPTLTSYAFTPYNRSYSGISSDLFDQDYEGGPPTGTITVTSPNGWETLAAGSTHTVTWSSTGGIGSVKIEYSVNNGTNWLTVVETTTNTGSYSWTVPGPASTACLVKVTDAASPGIYDMSDATFKIVIRDDFVGTWDGQGVYYRNSDTTAWVKMASPATMITTGDLDGDGIDDLIGLWPTQGGIWVKYSSSGAWAKLSSTAVHIAAGDMNGDGRTDLLGTWDGQGVYYRNSITGAWVKMASPATMITTGDIDGDKTDDLVGIWPSQGGVWVKYSSTGAWARLSSTARDIAAGDMNGDMRDDLLATWDGQGVFYRNSMTGGWIKMASEAEQVTCGDIDADGMDDLIGIWPTQGGVWVKYSSDGTWERLSSTARDITAGVMRAPGAAGAADEDQVLAAAMPVLGLLLPMGGEAEGPETGPIGVDVSDQGPGGARFVYLQELDLEPREGEPARLTRVPGPGEAGVIWLEQKNLFPQEMAKEIKKPIKK